MMWSNNVCNSLRDFVYTGPESVYPMKEWRIWGAAINVPGLSLCLSLLIT